LPELSIGARNNSASQISRAFATASSISIPNVQYFLHS
jgi:hypothetical protein